MNTRHLLPRCGFTAFAHPLGLLLLVGSLLLQSHAQAQCPSGTVTLTTQDQIDNFPAGCTNLPGTLTISGASIMNLNGLKNLQSVGTDLQIVNNPALTSIAALTALTSVSHYVVIDNNAQLANLSGLSKLQSTGYDLRITNNPALTSVAALTALTRVGLSMQIVNNAQLPTLNGLNNLQTVGNRAGDLQITDNSSLTSIAALTALTRVTNNVIIDNNAQLANLNGLDNLQTVRGDFQVTNNPVLTSIAALTALTTVTSSVIIDNNMELSSLNGLDKLQSVGNTLQITNNPVLTSIAALTALTRVSRIVQISNNVALTNLNGLDKLQSVGGDLQIVANPVLTSIAALTALTSVSAIVRIQNNVALANLNGLDKLQSVGGALQIVNNPVLTNIAALTALTSVTSNVVINNNAQLPSLNGLNKLQSVGSNLQITNNAALAVCATPAICQLIATKSPNNLQISGNAPGCSSLQEVQNNCIPQALAITTQPPSALSVCAGTTVTATVSTTGNMQAYQWYQNGQALTSQTSATLTLPSTTTADAGSYVVVVSNSVSSLTSTAFDLTVTSQSPDYQPLADLYNATNGPGWTRHDNWLTGCTPCGWFGVTCDGNGRVSNISLVNNKLSGSLPASLSALTSLQTLNLTSNQLSGSIPAGLSALTNLQILILNNNQLSGSIPASLSALTNLQQLSLNNNQLSGCFPASLSALCGKRIDFTNNSGLPGGGNFAAFCASGTGSDAFVPLATASPNPVCAGSPVSLSVSAGSFYQWSGPAGFAATTQTPTFTPATAASSGLYSVTVGNGSPTCTATTSVSLTVNPLPTVSIVGLPASICQEAAPVTLTGTSNPAGGTFTIDGTPATSFNPASLSVGQHTVVYSYTNTSGCSNTASQTVTVKSTPQTPTIATQSGHSYPGGVSSLTASQNTGNIILTASGCSGGTLTWAGGTSTTLAVSTQNTGTQTFTATCSQNGCTSPVATARVTVVGITLSVLHRDGNGQTNTNTLAPYLQLQNDGKTPIPYAEITVRYWLTVENYSPLQFNINYAQLGSDKVHLKYVPAPRGNPKATGYIEFSFDASAGSLAPLSNSGPIQDLINKQDYSYFDQSNDYSYANPGNFAPNERITAYRNGVLFYGMEPGPVVPTLSVKAQTQNNTGADANTIEAVLSVTNDGNQPINYGDLKVRYYFTADNNQPLVLSQVGYTALGSSNVTAQLITINPPLANADRYLELSFSPSLGQLAPGASTGGVTYQIRHADYSGFNQNNDYSYQGTGGTMVNPHVVVFVAGTRAYGTEPGTGGRLSAETAETPLRVQVLGNPVHGSSVEVVVGGAEGQPLTLHLTDLSGRSVTTRQIERAGATESQRLEIGSAPAGMLLLRVSTPTQSQTVKVLRQ